MVANLGDQAGQEPLEAPESQAPFMVRITERVGSRETLSQAMTRASIAGPQAVAITDLLAKMINLRTIRAGDVLVVEKGLDYTQAESPINLFELIRQENYGLPVRYRLERSQTGEWLSQKIETTVTEERTVLTGRISSSLYEGILAAGGDAALVNRFSELFGWQVDFYREAQKGDVFKMIVETKHAEGRRIGFGQVLAAEYKSGSRVFQGFRFESEDSGVRGFFDAKGESIEKGFLRSPMALTRITSRYGQRFHPVLQRQKKHNGVDYGAPTGTPFWSIADGVVLEARYSPTAGKMIRVRHRGGYVTEYFHASRIAAGIRPGSTVRQKQVIGYVGTTGRSTGPHLHFGMMLNKNYVDPSRQRFPAGQPLPTRLVERYRAHIKPLVEELKKIETPRV